MAELCINPLLLLFRFFLNENSQLFLYFTDVPYLNSSIWHIIIFILLEKVIFKKIATVSGYFIAALHSV